MRRRLLLAVSAVTGTVLALAGRSVTWIKPPRHDGRLSGDARELVAAVASAVLDDDLPAEPAARAVALAAHLKRLEATLAGMPPHMQEEIDRLMALLITLPGRLVLTGLGTTWRDAKRAKLQAALQDLRHSGLALRQQVLRALRDLTNGAYFADADSWSAIGYPGPRSL